MLSNFKDKYYDLCDYIESINPIAKDCYNYANSYYEELMNTEDNIADKTRFRKNILYLNKIKKNLEKINELLEKIDFIVDFFEEDVDIWVPSNLALPSSIYTNPSAKPPDDFLAHFPKNQP